MSLFKSNPVPALLLLIPLLIAACSGNQPAREAAAEPTAASAEPTAAGADPAAASAEPTAVSDEPAAASDEPAGAGDEYALGDSYIIDDFGFSIAIPAGWHADTREPITIINELESDHSTAFQGQPPQREGYEISLDHRDASFMAGLGLGEDPSLQDLLELNKGFFNWQEPIEVSETEAFGAPALAVKAFDGEDWGYGLMGFVNDETFLLSLGAPSEEALDAFLPTFEQMVASIAPAR